jgi:hypothetical protein
LPSWIQIESTALNPFIPEEDPIGAEGEKVLGRDAGLQPYLIAHHLHHTEKNFYGTSVYGDFPVS